MRSPMHRLNEDQEAMWEDEMLEMLRIINHKLSIQYRSLKMKLRIVKNCFVGSEMVELLIHKIDCRRNNTGEAHY